MAATQSSWHFCHKCFGMFYNGDQQGRRGRCPAGGGHEAYGFNFVLPHTQVDLPSWQGDWRFCHKCFGMFYGGDRQARTGRCPAGGSHDAYGLVFGLPHSVAETPGTQQQWRFCQKCFGMFYNGDPQGRRGRCPAGDGHEAYGLNFVLPHTAEFVQLPGGGGGTAPTQAAPVISVNYAPSSQTFTVSGRSFRSNHVVHVRFVNHLAVANPVYFDTTANEVGRFDDFPIRFPINVPQTYGISANDERTNPSDLSGTLWSNTVTITAT